ncbi:TPA: hypothetical protein ACJXXT_000201 [Pseudomonas aeruginosa]
MKIKTPRILEKILKPEWVVALHIAVTVIVLIKYCSLSIGYGYAPIPTPTLLTYLLMTLCSIGMAIGCCGIQTSFKKMREKEANKEILNELQKNKIRIKNLEKNDLMYKGFACSILLASQSTIMQHSWTTFILLSILVGIFISLPLALCFTEIGIEDIDDPEKETENKNENPEDHLKCIPLAVDNFIESLFVNPKSAIAFAFILQTIISLQFFETIENRLSEYIFTSLNVTAFGVALAILTYITKKNMDELHHEKSIKTNEEIK